MDWRNTFSYQYIRCCIFLGCLALFCLVNRVVAQQPNLILQSDFDKHNRVLLDDSVWFFHPGELPGGRQAATTTTGWDTLHHTVFGKTNSPRRWTGMGWFGLWIKADKGLVNRKLFIAINHDGASELFMDGKPIGGYGKVGSANGIYPCAKRPYPILVSRYPPPSAYDPLFQFLWGFISIFMGSSFRLVIM